MTRCYAVDQFTQAPFDAEFMAFQGGIDTTVDVLGLREPDQAGLYPLIVASGALAIQGLDAHNPRSDLDVIISIDRFWELQKAGTLSGFSKISEHTVMGWTRPSKDMPLSTDVFTSDQPGGYTGIAYYGQEAYQGVPNSSTVEVGGLHVLRATAVAADKLDRKRVRPKDLDILRAHVGAHSAGKEIVKDEAWRQLMAIAIDKVMTNAVDMTMAPPWREMLSRPKYPPWLAQLKRARFEHPAFQDIPRT